MIGLLVATVTVVLIVVLALGVAVAVTVLPLFVTLQLADARRFSTARWFTVSAATVVAGLACAYALHKQASLPRLVVALPLLLCWLAPGGLWLLDEGQTRLGGRAGRHE